jgi:hypothetical protein
LLFATGGALPRPPPRRRELGDVSHLTELGGRAAGRHRVDRGARRWQQQRRPVSIERIGIGASTVLLATFAATPAGSVAPGAPPTMNALPPAIEVEQQSSRRRRHPLRRCRPHRR